MRTQVPVIRTAAIGAAAKQRILVRPRRHRARQTESTGGSGRAIDRIHHFDAVGGGKRPRPARIADAQRAAARRSTAVDHQQIGSGTIATEIGIERHHTAVAAHIILDDQLVARARATDLHHAVVVQRAVDGEATLAATQRR